MKKVLAFEGTKVTTLHDDSGFLEGLASRLGGDRRVERASNIEFDNDTQLWRIYLISPPISSKAEGVSYVLKTEREIGSGFKTRAEAIQFEIDWINRNVLAK